MTRLAGKRIALAETRELDLLASMLEREEASVLRCPLVSIVDTLDHVTVEAWIGRIIAGGCQDVIFYTGEGVRRLVGFAERAGNCDAFVAALKNVRKITRGPKPVKALREIGLTSDVAAESPTTEGVIATLEREDLGGRRIGVQLYGQEPNAQLMAYLIARGAVPDTVAPYVYASSSDEARVERLIADMAAGVVDAIAFTSSPQYRRLEDVAEKTGSVAQLKSGLARTKVVIVGPVMAAELAQHGVRYDVMSDSPFSLKPLVRAIGEALASSK